MACAINLLSHLSGSGINTGGAWTLTSSTAGSGDLTASVNGGSPTIFSIGATVGASDNPSVDFGPASVGTYVLTYTVGSTEPGANCSDDATLTVTVGLGVTAGVDATVTLCRNVNESRNLYHMITGGNGLTGVGPTFVTIPGAGVTGSWSGTGIGGAGHTAGTSSITDDTFNPLNVPVGIYSFTYNVSRDGATNCVNCQDTSTVTITVVAAPNAGTDGAITVCSNSFQ